MIGDLQPLSERELEVLKLVATGATNQQIARDLVISPNTVKVHIRNIFEKLGVASRTEATMEAVRRGLVQIQGAAQGAAIEVPETTDTAPEPEPVALPDAGIAPWQRAYVVLAAFAVVLALFLPAWWRSRGAAQQASAFSDAGQPEVPITPRTDVPRWTVHAPLPEARSRLALVAAGDKLYAIGGEGAGGVSDEVDIYDPDSNGWLSGARKPIPVANISGALLDGRIYVPGGTLGRTSPVSPDQPTATPAQGASLSPLRPFVLPLAASHGVIAALEVYDPQADTWSDAAPLPAPRAAYALTVQDGKLYLFGGWDGTSYRAETYAYDPRSNTWAALTSMPERRGFMAAGSLQGLIYVVGGYDGEQELSTTEAYDPTGEGSKTGPWSVKAPLNEARAGLGLVSLSNHLYAIGGGWDNTLAYNEEYDVLSGAWSKTESPIVEQWRTLGLAADGEKIYAVGGWSGGYLALDEEYQAIYRILIPSAKSP
jgi:DNA-binding CsgD family transcriptional regulator